MRQHFVKRPAWVLPAASSSMHCYWPAPARLTPNASTPGTCAISGWSRRTWRSGSLRREARATGTLKGLQGREGQELHEWAILLHKSINMLLWIHAYDDGHSG